ncbi:hypothetical protein DC429_04560 [Arthrobacter sp. TPD3018]|uniref:hypothetical protein n=1 Tax=Bacteria TaxID=2 RepID=UPI000D517D41|nr:MULTISPECIES: hypothetical protein [Bacteria]PVE59668.1 hypothetical protein DC425_04555 [Sphingomonas sp. TPD3009]PVE61184.1 hypothetical protein DC429_04560 [Arthrobacter sp. TPD3018]PVE85896.1 hypothetical protein DC431_08620 [Sphingomonas melonis]
MSIVLAMALLAEAAIASPNPLPKGTVTVAIRADDDEVAAFTETVASSLSAADFLVLPPAGPSRYQARVTIDRDVRGLVTAPAPVAGPDVSVGNWGTGVRISLPTRKQDLRPLVVTRMTLTLVDVRSDRTLWTGTAVTTQVGGTAADDPHALGTKLADALVVRMPALLDGALSIP